VLQIDVLASLSPGSHPFLNEIIRYLSHIKGDSDGRKRLLHDMNAREEELRQHPDFDQILDEDREALSAFRKAAGFKSIRVETQDTSDAMDDRSEEKESDTHDSRKRGQAAADSPSSKQSFHSQSSRPYSMDKEDSETQHEESLTPRGLRQMTATDDSMSDSL
jgi:hypothetical protein